MDGTLEGCQSNFRYHLQDSARRATSARQRHQMRVVAHFNRLKPYRLRPQDLEALNGEEQRNLDRSDFESCADVEDSETDEPANLSQSKDGVSVDEVPAEDNVSGEATSATPLPQRAGRPMRRRRAPAWATSGDYVV